MKEIKSKIKFIELCIENLQYIFDELDLDDFDVKAYYDWSNRIEDGATDLLGLISTIDNLVEKIAKEDA